MLKLLKIKLICLKAFINKIVSLYALGVINKQTVAESVNLSVYEEYMEELTKVLQNSSKKKNKVILWDFGYGYGTRIFYFKLFLEEFFKNYLLNWEIICYMCIGQFKPGAANSINGFLANTQKLVILPNITLTPKMINSIIPEDGNYLNIVFCHIEGIDLERSKLMYKSLLTSFPKNTIFILPENLNVINSYYKGIKVYSNTLCKKIREDIIPKSFK